jgi:hypothetical protein
MKPIIIAASSIVTAALLSYAVAIVSEQRTRLVTSTVLVLLTIGVTLDITSTILMIIASSRGPFTLHGALGASSLAAMVINTILMWRHHAKCGSSALVVRWLHLYSRFAFAWWVTAYIAGGAFVALR